MDIELIRAPREATPVFDNLFQYYVYDFSEVIGAEVAADGRFASRSFDAYWEDAWRHPFLARVNGHYAGFALVHQRSHLSADPEVCDVGEFFVLRKYRRCGVGSALARQVFELFPGRWEVRQRLANEAATRFWRTVIADYTQGRFQETTLDTERWRGPVQSFDNAAR
ncbi:MAG: GNAT family N-acetyltransferase [Polyangiaceae bacterium]